MTIAFPLVVALAVASQSPEPGLHRVRVETPRECWVWSVPTPEGRFRPVEYVAATPAPPARPSFETNGVIAEKLDPDGGRTIRASDPGTLAEVRAVAAEANRKRPDPTPPVPPDDAPSGPEILPGVLAAVLAAAAVVLFFLGLSHLSRSPSE